MKIHYKNDCDVATNGKKPGEEKELFCCSAEPCHCDKLILFSSVQFVREVFMRKIVNEMLSKLAPIQACFYSLL